MSLTKKVYGKFNNASLDIDLVMSKPAYKPLVYEFISSFHLTNWGNTWNFRIQNTDFYWSKEEACNHLGFPMTGVLVTPSSRQRLNFWKELDRVHSLREPLFTILHFKWHLALYSPSSGDEYQLWTGNKGLHIGWWLKPYVEFGPRFSLIDLLECASNTVTIDSWGALP